MNSKNNLLEINSWDNIIINKEICHGNIEYAKIKNIENNLYKIQKSDLNLKNDNLEIFQLHEEFIDDFSDSEEENLNVLTVNIEIENWNSNDKIFTKVKTNLELTLIKNNIDQCYICLTKFKEEDDILKINNCNHIFHFICLSEWITIKTKGYCPLCK